MEVGVENTPNTLKCSFQAQVGAVSSKNVLKRCANKIRVWCEIKNASGRQRRTYARFEFKRGQKSFLFHDYTPTSRIGSKQFIFVGVVVFHIRKEKFSGALTSVLDEDLLSLYKNFLVRPRGVL